MHMIMDILIVGILGSCRNLAASPVRTLRALPCRCQNLNHLGSYFDSSQRYEICRKIRDRNRAPRFTTLIAQAFPISTIGESFGPLRTSCRSRICYSIAANLVERMGVCSIIRNEAPVGFICRTTGHGDSCSGKETGASARYQLGSF
jgi:hypothetical protein